VRLDRTPARPAYDVVIVGGAIMGAATAWFLTQEADFDGTVLVIERDMSFERASTSATNSCIRRQFSTPLNVEISRFTAGFLADLPASLGDDRVPATAIRNFGYLYLADTPAAAETLRANLAVQHAGGAATRLLTPDRIAAEYPFYALDGIVAGAINTVGEGWFDGALLDHWWRRLSRERGVEWVENEVVAMTRGPGRVEGLTLASGETVACGQVVNAAGPGAARVAAMAGVDLPVSPYKRMSWVFRAERPLDRPLPLTIDPSGVHVRDNGGGTYQAGAHREPDGPCAPDDFALDHDLWLDHVWPVLATRIPAFEAVRVESEWAGHYAMNVFDRNAIMGRHHELENLVFLNGFSGHGLQQSPAMGRGTAEMLVHGAYRSLDMSAFDWARIPSGRPIVETAVI
jgi:glycine/D-amino acid oxidase-like deaminating enzyme